MINLWMCPLLFFVKLTSRDFIYKIVSICQLVKFITFCWKITVRSPRLKRLIISHPGKRVPPSNPSNWLMNDPIIISCYAIYICLLKKKSKDVTVSWPLKYSYYWDCHFLYLGKCNCVGKAIIWFADLRNEYNNWFWELNIKTIFRSFFFNFLQKM